MRYLSHWATTTVQGEVGVEFECACVSDANIIATDAERDVEDSEAGDDSVAMGRWRCGL
jgi:hypothetical protein